MPSKQGTFTMGPWTITPVPVSGPGGPGSASGSGAGKAGGSGAPSADGGATGSPYEPAAGRFTANGQPRASRAAQFMPFAALTGYYELARQQEHVVEERHDLTEEDALALSRTMACVRRGDLIRVRYYAGDCYQTITGVVAQVDVPFRRIQVVQTVISFDDIAELERLE